MLIRMVRMTFSDEHVPVFLALFNDIKSKIREFEGCQRLELWQDLENPSVFTTYSWWDSEQHLNDYRSSTLFSEVWKNTRKGFIKPPKANSYKTVDQLF